MASGELSHLQDWRLESIHSPYLSAWQHLSRLVLWDTTVSCFGHRWFTGNLAF